MPGKTTEMRVVKQIIILHEQGLSNRAIAKHCALNKETVNNYIRKLKALDLPARRLLDMDDPELEGKFFAGNPAYLQDKYERLKSRLPQILKDLKAKSVTRKLLWEEYLKEEPGGYSYTQFCHHISQMNLARKGTAIVVHSPGDRLEVDFAGDRLSYRDPVSGDRIEVQVFVATLPYSQYTFAMAVPSQSSEDFLFALKTCLDHLGGCPRLLVPDNLKAAVIKANKYEPKINQLLTEFANHYGMSVLPTRVSRPRDKPSVENSVRLIYQRVYAKLRHSLFFSLKDLNAAIAEKVLEHNQTRMQRLAVSRQERFLAEELPCLTALPSSAFEVKHTASLTVSPDCMVYLGRDKHYYSVPYVHIGSKVSVVYTRTLVNIYCKGDCIATHPRSLQPGGKTFEKQHFGSQNGVKEAVNFDALIQQGSAISPTLGLLFEKYLQAERAPELAYRKCRGVLQLGRTSDPVVFKEACQLAYENNLLGYKVFKRILSQCAAQREESLDYPTPPEHKNIRGRKYYK